MKSQALKISPISHRLIKSSDFIDHEGTQIIELSFIEAVQPAVQIFVTGDKTRYEIRGIDGCEDKLFIVCKPGELEGVWKTVSIDTCIQTS